MPAKSDHFHTGPRILKGFHDCINQFTRTSHELYTGFQAGNYEGAPETMNLARAKMANVEESFRKMLGATVENV